MRLPTNDRELNKVVFKNSSTSEPRSINNYFNLKQISKMLENGDFSRSTRDWLYHAFECSLERENINNGGILGNKQGSLIPESGYDIVDGNSHNKVIK